MNGSKVVHAEAWRDLRRGLPGYRSFQELSFAELDPAR